MRSFTWKRLRGAAPGSAGTAPRAWDRRITWSVLGLGAALGLAGAAGCRSAVADFYDPLAGGGGSGGTGGTGGIPSECLGDPTQDPGLVRDECGVFVDAAAPTSGDGTKASPFKTVSEAAKTSKARFFVCAGTYVEAETVELANGVAVYGGFAACPPDGAWTWDNGERASIQGPAGSPVMKISGGENHIEGVNLVAPDALAPNASSIALVADSAAVDLVNVNVVAGSGAAGESGITPPDVPAMGATADSNSPTDACVVGTITGGAGAVTTCADGPSEGGDGGKGGTVPANNGEPGEDGLPVGNPGDGAGGTVEIITGVCTDGKDGADGELGEPGVAGTEKGTLTPNGILGGDGGDGKSGSRGQGGGGGGGAKAGLFCGNPVKEGAGASGGGGGAGGCAGKGGTGGRAGGSSIGVISLGSTFSFSGVLVTTADGGAGGAGALGVTGAPGGDGAKGGSPSGGTSKAGCDGGNGGYGGNGGSGGGGRGGHSAGIAFKGGAPSVEAGISFETGAAGPGGAGDPNILNDGAAGTASALLDFDTL